MQNAIRSRDVDAIKRIWDELIPVWDDRTFYGFIANSEAFMKRSFKHLEAFGQVGFGTGGWDTDFPNSMLEILRVVYTNCDDDQHFVLGGVEQVPRRMWKDEPGGMAHWPDGTSLTQPAQRRAAHRRWRSSRATPPARSKSPIPGAICANTHARW